MSQVFPKEIIENSVEVLLFNNKVGTQIIYSLLLLFIIAAFAAMPFIFLDIYTSSSGIIKAEKERHQIFSLYSGLITDIRLKENQQIQKGDTLLQIDNSLSTEKLHLTKEKLKETRQNIHDLNYLVTHKKIVLDSLKRYTYQKDVIQYRQKLRELNIRYRKIFRDFNRNQKLFDKKVIPEVEYLDSRYQLDLINQEINFFKKQQIDKWQAELTQLITYEKELESNLSQTNIEIKQYTLIAPISGTIQNLQGINVGSNLTAGKPICEISPDSNLIAECYVTPADIGLLKEGNAVKFQISTYNYNQ